jgi:excisionase family DNA binding protein
MLAASEVAKELGVHIDTVRRMPESALPVYRTKGGHRRYKESDVSKLKGEQIDDSKQCLAVIYSRVSSHDQKQKGDLDRQTIRNMEYCIQHGYHIVQTFDECSSGMNDNRPKLKALVESARKGEFTKLVIEHKDRLTRFNYKMYEFFLKQLGVDIICVEQVLPKSLESELVEDMLALVATFSAKIYGKRSHQNRKKKDVADYGNDIASAQDTSVSQQ